MHTPRTVLLSAAVLLAVPLAACGGSDERSTIAAGPSEEGVCAQADASDDLLAEICDRGHADGVDRPGVPAAVVARRGDRRVRRLRHRRRHRDRRPARRRHRVADAVLGRHHLRRLERPLGHERRLDDPDQRAAGGAGLHRAVLLHAGRGRRERGQHRRQRPQPPTSTARTSASAAAAPTSSSWTRRSTIEGFTFDFVIDDAEVKGYDTDTTALQDLALGDGTRLDAVITSLTTAQGYIDAGKPVKIVGDPVFYEPLAVAIDKSASADPAVVRRGRRRDRRRDARGRHAHRVLEEVVRRDGPDGRAVTRQPGRWRRTAGGTVGAAERPDGAARAGERARPVPAEGRRSSGWRSSSCSRCSSRWPSSTPSGCATTLSFIAGGLKYTLSSRVGGIVLAVVLAPLGALGADLAQPDRLRDLGLLRVVLPRHAADRADDPDLPRAAAGRASTSSTGSRASAQLGEQRWSCSTRPSRARSRSGSTTAPT